MIVGALNDSMIESSLCNSNVPVIISAVSHSGKAWIQVVQVLPEPKSNGYGELAVLASLKKVEVLVSKNFIVQVWQKYLFFQVFLVPMQGFHTSSCAVKKNKNKGNLNYLSICESSGDFKTSQKNEAINRLLKKG